MRALNLMIHCGTRHVDREQAYAVTTPDATPTWTPVPHRRLIELLVSTLPGYGLTLAQEAHALHRDNSRYFGLFQVTNGEVESDYNLVFGLRNSHDKSFSAGICLGSGVFICDNLAFSSEVVVGRKHTRWIDRDLPGLFSTAIGKLMDMRVAQDKRIASYKQTELTDQQAHDTICVALRGGAVNANRVPKVLDQWHTPNHPEFGAEKTAWRLFNAVTEALKESSLTALPARTQKLHGILDLVCEERVITSHFIPKRHFAAQI